jgi:hypothetical protein
MMSASAGLCHRKRINIFRKQTAARINQLNLFPLGFVFLSRSLKIHRCCCRSKGSSINDVTILGGEGVSRIL